MKLYDQHLHTRYSMDSQADPADNVRAAIAAGLAGITFTDHLDWHPSEVSTCLYDYEALAKVVDSLRQEFGSQIYVGLGIEICYQPAQMEQIFDYMQSRSFDIVLLSVHWMHGRPTHVPEQWAEWDVATATRAYLETAAEAVEFAVQLAREGHRPFDVFTHLDMIKRYTQRFRGDFDIASHSELVDRILRGCLGAGLILEVNTSSLRQGLDESMPAPWVVQRYAELGGKAIMLGSDAHEPGHIGASFSTVLPQIKSAGINQLAVFRERQCSFEAL